MPRAVARITRDPEIPWFVVFRCPYVKELASAIYNMSFPGCHYQKKSKTYLWPIESVSVLQDLCKELNIEVITDLSREPAIPSATPPSSRGLQG